MTTTTDLERAITEHRRDELSHRIRVKHERIAELDSRMLMSTPRYYRGPSIVLAVGALLIGAVFVLGFLDLRGWALAAAIAAIIFVFRGTRWFAEAYAERPQLASLRATQKQELIFLLRQQTSAARRAFGSS